MTDVIFTNPGLVPGGRLNVEICSPAARGWENWTPEKTHIRLEITDAGLVDVHDNVLQRPSHGSGVHARSAG